MFFHWYLILTKLIKYSTIQVDKENKKVIKNKSKQTQVEDIDVTVIFKHITSSVCSWRKGYDRIKSIG